MVFKKSIQKDIRESTQKIKWKCVESSIESKCFNYGRFILSPLKKGQADTIGIAMRRALLGEIKGTSITRAKFEKVKISHEYSRIVGIEEPVHEILLNLKQIILRSFTNRILKASICVSGPICVTAKDINLPPSVQIIDKDQYLFTLTEPIDFSIELKIERDRGYNVKNTNNHQNQDGSYLIDAVFMPVRNVNYTIHNFGNGNEDEEILFLEIWTNGSLTPREALREASMNLIGLFTPFLHSEEEDIHLKEKKNTCTFPPFTFKDKASELKLLEIVKKYEKYIEKKKEELTELKKKKKEIIIPWDCVFIDQLGFSSRTYNCLKKANINTVFDIFEECSSNCVKIRNFGIEEVTEIALKAMALTDVLMTWYQGLPNK